MPLISLQLCLVAKKFFVGIIPSMHNWQDLGAHFTAILLYKNKAIKEGIALKKAKEEAIKERFSGKW